MSMGSSVVRRAGANVFLTSEDEWYKAAYYDAASMSYFSYPAGSDTQTTCAVAGAAANSANCNSVEGDLTDLGSYAGSASPYGTFDQGGNVDEWTELVWGSDRGVRGGSFSYPASRLAAGSGAVGTPTFDRDFGGFRVASRQFPRGIPALGPFGLLLVASGLLGFGWYHRGRR